MLSTGFSTSHKNTKDGVSRTFSVFRVAAASLVVILLPQSAGHGSNATVSF